MKKPFNSMDVRPNDDGTFQIEIYREPEKKDDEKDGCCTPCCGERETMSASSRADCLKKIRAAMGGEAGDLADFLEE
jgi:hypothetical protein